ncbi:metal-sensing transcriptional repressor [Tepidibacillus marianensis]|uniref:metal-sensing transcriptional repressor n=1 Tax=Tepidibacillus marianensis TaxID=3131995 RepID=UPI0030CE0C6D
MAKEGRDCPNLLLQISAVQKALDSAAKVILKDHLEAASLKLFMRGMKKKY